MEVPEMLTREQILKVSRWVGQTGENEGFYEPNFEKHQNHTFKTGHTVKLNLACVQLSNGDVAIQKK